MTVSAVEMEEEDVPRNLQNTLFELFVWNGSIWWMGVVGGIRNLID